MNRAGQRIGAIVRELRLARGLSQGRFADRAAMHRQNVRRLERGDVLPTLDVIVRAARALEVPPSRLLAPLDDPELADAR